MLDNISRPDTYSAAKRIPPFTRLRTSNISQTETAGILSMMPFASRPSYGEVYNARFVFGNRTYPVVVQKFDYTWQLIRSGESQSRQRHVFYPKRVERSGLNVTIIFRNVEEYIKFGLFMRECHEQMTSSNNPYDLFFISSEIRHGYEWEESGQHQYGIKYSVAIESVPMKVGIDSVAPIMTLQMVIIRDMLELSLDGITGIESPDSGSVELDAAYDKLTIGDSIVRPVDISSSTGLANAESKYTASGDMSSNWQQSTNSAIGKKIGSARL